MTRREALDAEMRQVLAQLETCSHVPAANPGGGGSGRASDESIGGRRPPGDHGATTFARAYGPPFTDLEPRQDPGRAVWNLCRNLFVGYPADSDRERAIVREAARDELEHLRGYGLADADRPTGETPEQTVARMLAECCGLTPEQVQTTRFRMAPSTTRKHRRAAGLDPETGDPPTPEPQPDRDARARRARELRAKGMPLSSIAQILGVDKATVHRDLGKAA